MREFVHIAAFWVVLIVAIRLAVCFPRSLLARILFSHHGPLPVRGETHADYLFHCARFAAGWMVQAVFLFVAGWVALQSDASLADSLSFLVLWAVVVPVLAGIALLATLGSVARALWARWSRRAIATTMNNQSIEG